MKLQGLLLIVFFSFLAFTVGVNAQAGFDDMTLVQIIILAGADAVNPCALAVLTMILLSIVTYNPTSKRQILLAGLAFSLSIFITYLFYGLIIIKFFQTAVAVFSSGTFIIRTILGIIAIILGVMNIKDYLYYKPGGLGTEMPMKLRPLVKRFTSDVTSAKGAFVVGIFVTLFLLPCTIGPLFIAAGILSVYDLLFTLPILLLYNLIFIAPMLAITFAIYIGVRNIGDVSKWKEDNIKYLHLIAGISILLIGIAILAGWV